MNVLDQYDYFCFDLDGTIVDSESAMRKTWNAVASEFNLSIGFESYQKYVGLPFNTIMQNLEIQDKDGVIEKCYFETNRLYVSEVNIFQGFEEFLAVLKDAGKHCSVITSKSQGNAEFLLKNLNLAFHEVIGAIREEPGKPSINPFRKLVGRANIGSLDRVVYFGDMLSDLQFSVNCGIDYIHCELGGGPLHDLVWPKVRSFRSWKAFLDECVN